MDSLFARFPFETAGGCQTMRTGMPRFVKSANDAAIAFLCCLICFLDLSAVGFKRTVFLDVRSTFLMCLFTLRPSKTRCSGHRAATTEHGSVVNDISVENLLGATSLLAPTCGSLKPTMLWVPEVNPTSFHKPHP
eukprot:870363-Rhodomonas_salina.1